MTMQNPFFHFSKISEARFLALLEHFAADETATQAAAMSGLSSRSVNSIFLRIRQRMAESCCERTPEAARPAETAGGERNRLLGFFELRDWVCVEVAPSQVKGLLPDASRGSAALQWVVTQPAWPGYQALGDFDRGWFHRINPVGGTTRESSVEGLWDFTRARLLKFNGIHDRTFGLHLKECEFRFNHRHQDLTKVLSELLIAHPL